MMIIGAGNDNDQLKGVYFSQRVSVYTIGGSGLEVVLKICRRVGRLDVS